MITVQERSDVLDEMLNVYWLRPENALWYAYDVPIVRHLMGGLRQPSLDLGCGDGTTSFIMRGGRFNVGFDAYRSVRIRPDAPYEWTGGQQDDYYNYAEDQTVDARRDIVAFPVDRYSVGLDWKEPLLQKAAQLSLYERTVQHDANHPLEMFADGEFKSIFSNVIYWIDDLDGLLAELARVLAPDGCLVVTCPNESIRTAMLYQFQRDYGLEWIKDLDRGRCNSYKHAYSGAEWLSRFEAAGLIVEQHIEYGADIVLTINDFGLRPLFPSLMEIYKVLREKTPDDLVAIKKRWVANCRHFLRPLLDDTWMDQFGMQQHWHAFQLRRSGD